MAGTRTYLGSDADTSAAGLGMHCRSRWLLASDSSSSAPAPAPRTFERHLVRIDLDLHLVSDTLELLAEFDQHRGRQQCL